MSKIDNDGTVKRFTAGDTPIGFKAQIGDGYLVFAAGFKVQIRKRPNRFHRLMMRLLLGWKWEQ